MIIECTHCDPKFFVIFGFCRSCGRRCEAPLFDPKGEMSLLDYDKFRAEWNKQRSDLFNDKFRRIERD